MKIDWDQIRNSFTRLKKLSGTKANETVVAAGILLRLLKNKKISEEEVRFLKNHSIDIVKIIGILGLGIISVSIPIALGALLKRKYGINIFPEPQEIPKRLNESKNLSDYFLILDDDGHTIRHPSLIFNDASNFVIATSVDEFKNIIETRGVPKFLSLDHDLGQDENGDTLPTGYDAVKWLVYVKEADIRNMQFKAHTANIQTREQMEGLLKNWQKELEKRNKVVDEIRKTIRKSLVENMGPVKKIKFPIAIPGEIRKINDLLTSEGFKLYLVGGSVRDALMGISPKDYDLATDALPDKIQEILHRNGYKTLEIGKAFGIINALTKDGEFEIATFRSDSYSEKPDLEGFKQYLKSTNEIKYQEFIKKLMK